MPISRPKAALAAIAAVVGGLYLAPSTCADIVVPRGGETIPKGAQLDENGFPMAEAIEASKSTNITEFSFDTVKIGGRDVPAGQVYHVEFDALLKNNRYNEGEVRVSSGFWADAAESFRSAAEELKGPAKQYVLYKWVVCVANTGDLDATLQASDAMLAEFPKAFHFGPVQIKRALVFASKGRTEDAVAALQKVTGAPGMNARDYFEAEYTRVWLTKMAQARLPAALADAEKEFRAMVSAIDAHPRGRQDAPDQRLKAQARIGVALALQNKADEARKLLEPLVHASDKTTDKSALGAAYTGLGNALFAQAADALKASKRDEAKALSEDAVLAYERVLLMYADSAEVSDRFNAEQNCARLFKNLFNLSGEKDCESGKRAYEHYRAAVGMLDMNEQRRTLIKEGTDLKAALDKACAK
jgi:tetratricopeptide (TPR) repeat protein